MLTHRPARPAIAAAALALAVALAPAASAAPSHRASSGKHKSAKIKSKGRESRARRSDDRGLVVRWTGTPRAGGHAGTAVSDTYVFGGDLFMIAHTTSADDQSIWGPLIDTGTVGVLPPSEVPVETAGTSELQSTKTGACYTGASYAPAWRAQRDYATGFRQSVEVIELLRTHPSARQTLAAGPALDGRPTLQAKVDTWPTLDRTGATVLFDAASGAVRRITPIGFPEFAVDLTAWSVQHLNPAQLRALAPDPELNLDVYVDGPCA